MNENNEKLCLKHKASKKKTNCILQRGSFSQRIQVISIPAPPIAQTFVFLWELRLRQRRTLWQGPAGSQNFWPVRSSARHKQFNPSQTFKLIQAQYLQLLPAGFRVPYHTQLTVRISTPPDPQVLEHPPQLVARHSAVQSPERN